MKKILPLLLSTLAASAVAQASPCLYDLCVGESILNIRSSYRTARIVGIDRGTYVLRYWDTGAGSAGWKRADLAVTHGCAGRFCVGDLARNQADHYRLAMVVGLEWNGSYVLRDEQSDHLSGGWWEDTLLPASGQPPQPPVVVRWVCHLTTPSRPEPGYVSSGGTEREAFESAIQRCLAVETPYQCRRNSQMRCEQSLGQN